jgi:hypothetical protein
MRPRMHVRKSADIHRNERGANQQGSTRRVSRIPKNDVVLARPRPFVHSAVIEHAHARVPVEVDHKARDLEGTNEGENSKLP